MGQLLTQLGLTAIEEEIYLDLARHGGSRVTEIAKRIGKQRASLHDVLRSLVDRGFLNYTKEGNIQIYQAEDPDKFLQMMHERLFAFDKLKEGFSLKREKKQKSIVQSLQRKEAERTIRRIYKKEKDSIVFGNNAIRAIVDKDHVVLAVKKGDLEGLHIQHKGVATLHKALLKKYHGAIIHRKNLRGCEKNSQRKSVDLQTGCARSR